MLASEACVVTYAGCSGRYLALSVIVERAGITGPMISRKVECGYVLEMEDSVLWWRVDSVGLDQPHLKPLLATIRPLKLDIANKPTPSQT
jgi:hypothetical protein